MKAITEAVRFPGLLTIVLLALWRLPAWGQRILAFLRDLRDYRDGF